MKQTIFKLGVVEKLEHMLRSGESLEKYYNGGWQFDQEDYLQDSVIEAVGKKPQLIVDARNINIQDTENAIKIHEYLPSLSRVQASDKRLWAYLTHVDFFDYCKKRWEFGADFDELDTPEKKESAASHYRNHWFTASSARSLRRNALARLWWPAHLTYAPWERYPGQGIPHHNDKYIYTKVLLSSQDTTLQILERSISWNPILLIAILEYLRKNPEIQGTKLRNLVRNLVININLLSGTRNLALLQFEHILAIIEDASKDYRAEEGDA